MKIDVDSNYMSELKDINLEEEKFNNWLEEIKKEN